MKNPFKMAAGSQNHSIPGTPVDDGKEVMIRAPGEYGPDPRRLRTELASLRMRQLEEANLKALDELTQRTDMPITQENGQRRYGPPLGCDEIPPRGSEVFVGKLPRDCFEPELVHVFEQVGRIYELRLMMDFSGSNRGYCFVQYFTPEEADRAIKELNNYEIRRGRTIGVVLSVDNCRLYFGAIPKDKTDEEFHTEIDKLTDGVVRAKVFPGIGKKHEKPRPYAFVEFTSHKAAAMARRKLVSGKVQMWGKEVSVDWAEPLEQRDSTAPKSPKKLERVQRLPKKTLPVHSQDRAPMVQFRDNQFIQEPSMQGRSFPGPSNVILFQKALPVLSKDYAYGPRIQLGGNQFIQGPSMKVKPVPGPSNANFILSIQQQSLCGPGGFPKTGQIQGSNNQASGSNYSMGQFWCGYGVPGVPPNVYFGQWSHQLR